MKTLLLTRPSFGENEIDNVRRCLASGWVTQGPYVSEFEQLFSKRHQVPHAIATTSCTAALHLAILASGIGPGDEVVVPAFTWVTSANCAEYVGAKAVFADVERDTYNIDPESLKQKITSRTKAVVVVHLFGLAANMEKITEIANLKNLVVIEDAACAVGTVYNDRPVGGIGQFGCFSFHPRKVITTGEGGMVTTTERELADRVISYENHGTTEHRKHDVKFPIKPYHRAEFGILGYNFRLSDIQAAVGVAQMAKLDYLLEERKRLAERYTRHLQEMPEIAVPVIPPKCGHTFQSYVIRLKKGGMARRNAIMDHLSVHNIQTRPGTHAVHRLGYYASKYSLKPDDFPIAAESEDTTITLPIFPGMTASEQDKIMGHLEEMLRKFPQVAGIKDK
jgi:perosamine synthetase